MEKKLSGGSGKTPYYIGADGTRKNGVNPQLTGDVSKIYGNTSNVSGKCAVSGNVSWLKGDVSKIRGKIHTMLTGMISGLSGDVTGVYGGCSKALGNLDECKLSAAERANGVHISKLIG